jgi:hypothetical protein
MFAQYSHVLSLCFFVQKYGDLDHVTVIRDRSTGESKGFGYVRYHRPYHASLAFENCNQSECHLSLFMHFLKCLSVLLKKKALLWHLHLSVLPTYVPDKMYTCVCNTKDLKKVADHAKKGVAIEEGKKCLDLASGTEPE